MRSTILHKPVVNTQEVQFRGSGSHTILQNESNKALNSRLKRGTGHVLAKLDSGRYGRRTQGHSDPASKIV